MKLGAELSRLDVNSGHVGMLTHDGTIMNSWKAKRPPAWELQIISQIYSKSYFKHSPSVKDVHEWDWENVWLLGSGKVGNVGVEWDTL